VVVVRHSERRQPENLRYEVVVAQKEAKSIALVALVAEPNSRYWIQR
jgi:hypothetical protein